MMRGRGELVFYAYGWAREDIPRLRSAIGHKSVAQVPVSLLRSAASHSLLLPASLVPGGQEFSLSATSCIFRDFSTTTLAQHE
jgi:hypothetical protein